jgi:hypothetical protein
MYLNAYLIHPGSLGCRTSPSSSGNNPRLAKLKRYELGINFRIRQNVNLGGKFQKSHDDRLAETCELVGTQ